MRSSVEDVKFRAAACLFLMTATVGLLGLTQPARAEVPPAPASYLYTIAGTGPTQPFRAPMGVYYDANHDELYVADTGNHRIVILDRDGYPLHEIRHYVTQNGQRIPGEPRGITVDPEGRIYVVDALSPDVDVLDTQGLVIGRISPRELLEGVEEVRAQALRMDSSGRLYLGVTGDYAGVLVLDSQWELIRAIPPVGTDDSLEGVAGIALDDQGRIYVADPSGVPAIRIYDAEGNLLAGFGRHDIGYENFSRPSGLTVDREGIIWVVDTIRQVVKAFHPGGQFLTYVGGRGDGPMALSYPSAVDTDGRDRLFVVSRLSGRLVCYAVEGEQVLALAGGSQGGTSPPRGKNTK
jgi:sugar lactone lactonase YvrE